MFGWEFPPYFAGGVGIVCFELAKELVSEGVELEYVMPYCPDTVNPGFLDVFNTKKRARKYDCETSTQIQVRRVRSLLSAYQTKEEYERTLQQIRKQDLGIDSSDDSSDNTLKLYGEDLLDEIDRFSRRTAVLFEHGDFGDFDVIHAHDWTTVPAATVAKRLSGKPLIVHCHITEVNKNAGKGVNQEVYDIERTGFFAADKVFAVSEGIKQTLIDHYGVPGEKVHVVHNGGVAMEPVKTRISDFKGDNRIVSFMGRITGMKGPENFIRMAQKVLAHVPNTKFIMAGSGDKLQACIDLTKELGIYDKFYFHGFYSRKEANYFFDISDVFILPSLMEPFGVTPLEAMQKETPVIVSKQSGVSEVLNHCFKVDFWDIDKMASQVIALLKYRRLHKTMTEMGYTEAKNVDWKAPAQKCIQVYKELSGK
ncbi:MAG: glycosyltransferase family 4 protein, partial [Candidatus Woesearchaeota archaeon]